jgi:three-Cys-motif partner protein
MADFEPDEIGYWSEVKLDILREYAAAYSKILSAQTKKHNLDHIYIDGFAGAGVHRSREHGDLVTGSPINALNVKPPFKEYHFIDLNGDKTAALKKLVGDHPTAHVHNGDCNKILIETVFPRVKYEDFRRGLCVLDPYGLNLKWEVMKLAGQMGTIDMFLNFMVMDMNRNVLWRNPANVTPTQKARMNEFWGDESWLRAGYSKVETLFDVQDQSGRRRPCGPRPPTPPDVLSVSGGFF